jgi:serine/threonine-protein kinase
MALLWAHMSDPAPSVASLRPGLPQAVDGVIARGMAKSPDDRYPSCGAFAAALRQSLSSPGSSQPGTTHPGSTHPAPEATHPATVLSPPRGSVAAPAWTAAPTAAAPAPPATTQPRFTNPAFSQPPAAPFRGTPPSPQSANRPVPQQSALREWFSDNIRIRAVLIGAGVIVVLIIFALTTHG